MIIERVEELKRDLKKLEKKFGTIQEDLRVFEKALSVNPRKLSGVVLVSYREVKIKPEVEVYKARKFRCKSLKGRGSQSGIRVIYGFWPELDKITISEIYYEEKKKKDCDLGRLNDCFGV